MGKSEGTLRLTFSPFHFSPFVLLQMELEFDKEIDALMRKGAAGIGVTPSVGSGAHLDADELSAFAEHAMPEKMRALYMRHLADCDRCRKILSGLIMLNAEAELETAASVAVGSPSSEVPWYKRLFLFPNLAYAMGGLVLVFGGLIAISVLQSSQRETATVTQMTESDQGHVPMAASEPDFYAANAANATANAAANTNAASMSGAPGYSTNTASNSMAVAANALPRNEREVPSGESAASGVTADGVDPKAPAVSAAAPLPPPAKTEIPKDAELAMKPDAAAEDKMAAKEKDDDAAKNRSLAAKKVNEQPRTQAGGQAKATPGPTRDMQQNFPNRADNTFELNSRRVGGKDFQFKNGVWYDNAYRGQSTINVRRGTDEYRKLDGGLRSIAESLRGTVVVVWNEKAYRIQ
ncbi:MAG: zf-HC2 domain-containing protein [Blastocatellia bacterium]|nr:zf-HC2 domain-containing protein [Blastocatellia bacterium]